MKKILLAIPFIICMLFIHGCSDNTSQTKTFEWYEKAAAQGHADAQYNLGYKYYTGQDVDQNHDKALEWFEKAAKQGHAKAQYHLGESYAEDEGKKADYTKVRYWYEKAAAQGNADAQFGLAIMYAHGLGVEQDYTKAREWDEKAAAQGHAGAQFGLGTLYNKGHGVEQDHVKAKEWFEKAAAQGYADAQFNLGILYHNGEGTNRDYSKAVEWFEKAIAQGHADAQYLLGVMYEKGRGVKQDYARARELQLQAMGAFDSKENRPKFEDYLTPVYTGKTVLPTGMVKENNNEIWRDELGGIVHSPEVNFAGKYFVYTARGMYNLFSLYRMIDLSTGKDYENISILRAKDTGIPILKKTEVASVTGRHYARLIHFADSRLFLAQFSPTDIPGKTATKCRERYFELEESGKLKAISKIYTNCAF